MPSTDGQKLTYFNIRGRAELVRLIFAQSGVEYEDRRVEFPEWAELKPTTKWGSLPMLDKGDLTLGQSVAIVRHVSRCCGLAGKDNFEQAQVDGVVDAITDLFNHFMKLRFCQDEEEKAELKTKFAEDHVPNTLAALEKILVANGGKYMVGNELTHADLAVFSLIDGMKRIEDMRPLFEKNDKLGALTDSVAQLPKIKKWLEERPETEL